MDGNRKKSTQYTHFPCLTNSILMFKKHCLFHCLYFYLVDGTIIMVFIQFLLIELVTRCVISTSFPGVSISDNLTNCILFHTILCHKKMLKQGCDEGFEGRRKVYNNMKRYLTFLFHGNIFLAKEFYSIYEIFSPTKNIDNQG